VQFQDVETIKEKQFQTSFREEKEKIFVRSFVLRETNQGSNCMYSLG